MCPDNVNVEGLQRFTDEAVLLSDEGLPSLEQGEVASYLCGKLREFVEIRSRDRRFRHCTPIPSPSSVVKYHRRHPDFPCYSEFIKAFGRFSIALERAGLKPPETLVSREDDLIRGYVALYEVLKYPPSPANIEKHDGWHGYPSVSSINIYFGCLAALKNQVIQEGYDIRDPEAEVSPELEKREQMKSALSDHAQVLACIPTFGSIQRANEDRPDLILSPQIYIEVFGSIPYARVMAGVENKEQLKAALIEDLSDLARRLGRCPIAAEYVQAGKRGECHIYKVLENEFGSWTGAKEAADLSQAENSRSRYCRTVVSESVLSPGELQERRDYFCAKILELARLSSRHGVIEAPSVHRISEQHYREPSFPCFSDIVKAFGRYSQALKAAGFEASPELVATEDELIKGFAAMSRTLGHVPTSREVHVLGKNTISPTLRRVCKYFGCIGNLKQAALAEGLELGTEEAPRVDVATLRERPSKKGAHRDIRRPRRADKSDSRYRGRTKGSGDVIGNGRAVHYVAVDKVMILERVGDEVDVSAARNAADVPDILPGAALVALEEEAVAPRSEAVEDPLEQPAHLQPGEVSEVLLFQIEMDLLALEARNDRALTSADLKGFDLSSYETGGRELLQLYKDSLPALLDALRSRLLLELYRQIKERGCYTRVHQIGGVHRGLARSNYYRHFSPANRSADIDDVIRSSLEALFVALAVRQYSGSEVKWEDVRRFEKGARKVDLFAGKKLQADISRCIQGIDSSKQEWREPPMSVMQIFFGGAHEFSLRVARYMCDRLEG